MAKAKKSDETVLLKFLKARGYRGEKILTGQTVEVDAFWAKIFLADGTAENAAEKTEKK